MAGLLDLVDDEEKKGIKYQNLFGTLINAGLNAVAAGGNMMDNQRAPYIAAAGQAFGNMGEQNAAQIGAAARQKLMSQQYAESQQKLSQQKETDAYMKSPEFLNAFAGAPPEIQAMVKISPAAAMNALSNWRQAQATAAAENRRLLADQQKNLQAGWQIKSDDSGNMWRVNAITGEKELINNQGDVFTKFGIPNPNGQSPQPQQQSTLPAAFTTPFTGLRNELTPEQKQIVSAPPQPQKPDRFASVPEGEYARIWGVPGALNNMSAAAQNVATNTLTPNSAYDEAMRNNYKNARLDALKAVSADMPGRSTKASLEKIQSLMPNMDNPFVGKDSAYASLIAVRDELDSEIQKLNIQMQTPANAKERHKIAANIQDLYKARDNMTRIAEGTRTSYGRGGRVSEPQTQERKPQGGPRRYNPQTGMIE